MTNLTPIHKWDEIVNTLRRYKPLSKVAIEIGIDAGTLRRIARGDTPSPKYEYGVELLKMYNDLTGDICRLCTKCGAVKPITSFHHKITNKDGRNTQCNTCINSKYGQHVNPLFSRVLGRKL